jgi:hypothetical protein
VVLMCEVRNQRKGSRGWEDMRPDAGPGLLQGTTQHIMDACAARKSRLVQVAIADGLPQTCVERRMPALSVGASELVVPTASTAFSASCATQGSLVRLRQRLQSRRI